MMDSQQPQSPSIKGEKWIFVARIDYSLSIILLLPLLLLLLFYYSYYNLCICIEPYVPCPDFNLKYTFFSQKTFLN